MGDPIGSIDGYRFPDLQKAGIVSSRGALFHLQRHANFPRPIKIGTRSAWWIAAEVHAWLEERRRIRDATPKPASKPRDHSQHFRKLRERHAARKAGKPRKARKARAVHAAE
jgi:predicted DNA-binding transcriptional regulator AlpA